VAARRRHLHRVVEVRMGVKRINPAGLALIKEFEGFRSQAYLCPANVWTIGYGHTRTAQPGMVVSEAEAERLLRDDVASFEEAVANVLRREPNENQFAAMVSLAFNIGAAAFIRSTVLREFNAGRDGPAASAFAMWNKAGGVVLSGLIRRRAAEAELFMAPPPPPPAPPRETWWARIARIVTGLWRP
jgi:lysozyme